MTFEEYLYDMVFRKGKWSCSLGAPSLSYQNELNLFHFNITTPYFDIEYTIADDPYNNSHISFMTIVVWYKTDQSTYVYRVIYDVLDFPQMEARDIPYTSLVVTIEDDLTEQIKDELLIKLALL